MAPKRSRNLSESHTRPAPAAAPPRSRHGTLSGTLCSSTPGSRPPPEKRHCQLSAAHDVLRPRSQKISPLPVLRTPDAYLIESAGAAGSARGPGAGSAEAEVGGEAGESSSSSEETETIPSPGQASRGRQLQRRGVRRVRRAAGIGDLGGITPLEAKTVSVRTRKGCQREVEQWSAWSSEHGQEVNDPAALDQSLLLFPSWLSSLALFSPENGKYGSNQMPTKARALKGWRRATPRHSRLPFSWQVITALSLAALQDGSARLAFGPLLAVEAYLRPSELLGVRCGDFFGPAPGGATVWVLPLHLPTRTERS